MQTSNSELTLTVIIVILVTIAFLLKKIYDKLPSVETEDDQEENQEIENDNLIESVKEVFTKASTLPWNPNLKLYEQTFCMSSAKQTRSVSAGIDFKDFWYFDITVYEDHVHLQIDHTDYMYHGFPGDTFLLASIGHRNLRIDFDIITGEPSLIDDNFTSVTDRELIAVNVNTLRNHLFNSFIRKGSSIKAITTDGLAVESPSPESNGFIELIQTDRSTGEWHLCLKDGKTIPINEIITMNITDCETNEVLQLDSGLDKRNSPFIVSAPW